MHQAVAHAMANGAPPVTEPSADNGDLVDPTVVAAEAIKGEDKKDPFDQWDLTPEVRALMLQVAQCKDRDQLKGLMEALEKQGVPKSLVEDVMTGQKSLFGKAWHLINGGKLSQATLGKDGQIDNTFKLDGKGIGWDNAKQGASVDWSDGGKATYVNRDKNINVDTGYSAKNKTAHAKVVVGDGKEDAKHTAAAKAHGGGGEASYQRVLKDEVHEGSASFRAEDGSYDGKASYMHKDGKTSEKYSAAAKHEDGKGGVITLNAAHTGGKSGKEKTSGKLEALYGETVGARSELDMARKAFTLKSKLNGSYADNDQGTSTKIGGSGDLLLRGKDAKSKKDDVKLGINGAYTGTDDAVSGAKLDRFEGGASTAFGNSSIKIGGNTERGQLGNKAYAAHGWDTKLSQGFGLDKAKGQRLDTRLSGGMSMTDKPGDFDSWRAGLGATYTSSKKKGAFSLAGDVSGGQASGQDIRKNIGLPGTVPVGGSGSFLDLDTKTKWGGNTLTGGLSLGQSDGFDMGGFNLGYDHKKANGKSNFMANVSGAGVTNGNLAGGMLSGDMNWKPSDKWSLGAGGSYKSLPSQSGQQTSWNAQASVGYNWAKDGGLTMKGGVAGNGDDTRFIPELNLKSGKNIDASVMGAFGKQTPATVGGKLKLPGGLSLFGGYGDMTALDKPYEGNAGMSLAPNFGDDSVGWSGGSGGSQAFVGATWDMLETARKWGIIKP
jgi:hypothetical protein